MVCLLFKAMNGLTRAPKLWFYQVQRIVYALGGEDTFESTLFTISTKKGLILIFVYVDDLLIASQDQRRRGFLSQTHGDLEDEDHRTHWSTDQRSP